MRTGQNLVLRQAIRPVAELGATEAYVVVAVVRLPPVAVGSTHVAGVVVPTAATNNAVVAFLGFAHIFLHKSRTFIGMHNPPPTLRICKQSQ